MAIVKFTPNLRRHVECPSIIATGSTVAEVLSHAFGQNPILRGYVVDDQGGLRKHMLVFVDGVIIQDRQKLSDAVKPDSELFIMQALSGG